MFKLIGITFSFAACAMLGFYKAHEVRQRKILLIEFEDLILHIYTEIGYFKDPLPVIFERLMSNKNTLTDQLLRQCYLNYQSTAFPQNFADIWTDAIKTTYKHEPLKSDDIAIFLKCGSFLGQSDFESQKGHFALLRGQLETQIHDADTEIKTKGAVYSKAGISIGAVIAIALI